MTLIESIKKSFYPEVYSESIPTNGNLKLCLLHKKSPGRYCLAVLDYNPSKSIETQIREARGQIKQHTGAMWFFREIGAYIVFYAETLPDIAKESLPIDRTGLHSVIIQGVHIISRHGEHIYNHSKWKNTVFGSATDIAARLKNVAI